MKYQPEVTKMEFPVEEYFIRTVRSDGQENRVEPVFLDLETTGLNPATCDVVEWGLLSLTETLLHAYTLPRAGVEINKEALEINGFDAKKAKQSPSLWVNRAALLREGQKLWANKVIVGSNPLFDASFIARDLWDLLRERPTWFYRPVDLSTLVYFQLEQLASMRQMAEAFQTTEKPVHTAISDAAASREVYISIFNDLIRSQKLAESLLAENDTDTDDLSEYEVPVGGSSI